MRGWLSALVDDRYFQNTKKAKSRGQTVSLSMEMVKEEVRKGRQIYFRETCLGRTGQKKKSNATSGREASDLERLTKAGSRKKRAGNLLFSDE